MGLNQDDQHDRAGKDMAPEDQGLRRDGSDEVFRLALTHAGIGMAIIAPDGSFLEVNDALCRLLGRDEHALTSSTWQEMTHPDDLAVDLGLADEVLSGLRDGYRLSKRYLRPDGTIVHGDLSVAAVRDGAGDVRFFVSQILDETEQVELRERYRLLAENASDVIGMGDNDGVLRWVSPSVTAFLGWDPADLVDRPFAELIEPEDRPAVAGLQAEVLAGRLGEAEARMRHADGTTRWTSIRVKPVFDAQGRMVGRVGAWWDVTERRRAQAALAASEERLRAALDAEIDAHVFLTAVRDEAGVITDFIYTHANEQAAQYVRRSVADLVGKPLLTLFPGQRTSGMFDRYRAVIETGEPLILDGISIPSEIAFEIRNFDFRGVRFQDSISLTWRDVTERVRAERALEVAEERYRLAAANATDIVIGVGATGDIDWAFGSLHELLGIEPSDLVGRPGSALADLMVEAPAAELDERRASIERGDTLVGLVELRRPDGSTHWFDRRTKPVRLADGSLQGVVVSLRDAQAEVEFRAALEQAAREARDLAQRYEVARNEALEANLAKTAFLSRMSHELRTPLNAVLGFAQLLAMDPLTDEQQEAVQSIRTGGRHLLDLISEILDISRIEAGRLSLSMEAVHVGDAVQEAFDLISNQATALDVHLTLPDQSSCDGSVWADRQRVIQVLLNLLSNAVKYNRPGGHVRVGCTALEGGEIAIHVTDDGIGIPEKAMARLFEPFDRLGAESTKVEGTGIGLALSRGLAVAMGGRIEVASEVGRGSTFSLVLRSVDAVRSTTILRPIQTLPIPGRTTRVLYVEDNPANVSLMRRILGLREGASLDVAIDGASGLQSALAEPPDLVLLDLHLPDIPGEDVLRRLKAARQTADVPVVVVTADASPDVRHRVLALGAQGVVHKPVDVVDVLAWVDDPTGSRLHS